MRLQFNRYRLLFAAILVVFTLHSSAQYFNPYYYGNSISVGKKGYAPSSAWLEIGNNPTTKGLVLPRVLNPDSVKDAIPGIIVFSLQDESLYFRTSTGWIKLCSCGVIVPPAMSFSVSPLSQAVAASTPFSLTASVQYGTGPYTWSWYVVGNSSAQITSTTTVPTVTASISGITSNADWYVKCTTGSNGSIYSDTAHITINTNPVIIYGYSSVDPYIDNATIPTISNSASITVSHNADLSISFPSAAVNKFLVFKIPSSEPIPLTWFSTSLNNGTIPDAAFRTPFTIGGYTYCITRDAAGLAFDYSVPIQLKH